jgi:hypothetical protein
MNELEHKLNALLREVVIHAIQLNNEYWYLLAISTSIFLYLAIIAKLPFLKIVFLLSCIVGLGFEYLLFAHGRYLGVYYRTYPPYFDEYFIIAFISIFAVTFCVTFLFVQKTAIIINTLVDKVSSKSSLERLTDTDIRRIDNVLPKRRKPYKPSRYFKKKYVFLGINEIGKPRYLSLGLWRKSHVQISGTTGCGKGVFAAMLCTQALRNNETVVIFDPKSDEFLPHILANQCCKQDLPYFFIYLLGTIPQINLFKNKSCEQVIELLSAGFNLADTGAEADFYKLFDRRAAGIFAQFISSQDKPLQQCLIDFCTNYADLLKEAPKFAEAINEISQLPVLHAKDSHWLKFLESGATIYIKGSMRNPKALKLRKMVLLSLMQQCESRELNFPAFTRQFVVPKNTLLRI